MRRIVRKFFQEFDMFSAYATFRTRGQSQARNACGGGISFLLYLYFTYVFIAQFNDVANWKTVKAIQTLNSTFDKSRQLNQFMVGIGLEGFRIEGIMEFLRFQIKEVTKNGSKTISQRVLRTQKCQLGHWSTLGDKTKQNFDSYNLVNKLCIVPGQNFEIQRPSNDIYRVLKLQVNACRRMYQNDSFMYDNCADVNLTNYKNQIWIRYNKYFVVSVVYLNTAFNSLSQTPENILMESVRLTFTITQGAEAFVSLSTYQIQTDTNILPFESIDTLSGYTVDKVSSNNYEIVWYFEHASCTFSLSSNSILIERALGKVDEILSFVGGLFGIIISFLGFFMMSFNEYRYQLMAAENSFDYDQDGKKIKEGNFNFYFYVKYQIFDWIKHLFCVQLPWKDCKQIDQTRQQATNQLEIALMFKKIQYFQRFIEYIISDKEKIGLFLTEPPSLEEVIRKRMMAEYYDSIMLGDKTITMQDLDRVPGLIELAMSYSLIKMSSRSNVSRDSEDSIRFSERGDPLQSAIRKFQANYEKGKEPDLTEEEKILQRKIAQEFFNIQQSSRKKIQRKIPLKILSRLYKINNPTIDTVMTIDARS